MEIGGGFGGKTTIYLEPLAVALSKKSGAPVKVTMNRIEVMEASGPTSGSWMKVKMALPTDGRMTAAHADLRFEAGAFPGSPVGAAANCIFSPYDIPNIVIDPTTWWTTSPRPPPTARPARLSAPSPPRPSLTSSASGWAWIR